MVWQEEADRRSEDCLQPHQEHVQGTHFGKVIMGTDMIKSKIL